MCGWGGGCLCVFVYVCVCVCVFVCVCVRARARVGGAYGFLSSHTHLQQLFMEITFILHLAAFLCLISC